MTVWEIKMKVRDYGGHTIDGNIVMPRVTTNGTRMTSNKDKMINKADLIHQIVERLRANVPANQTLTNSMLDGIKEQVDEILMLANVARGEKELEIWRSGKW